MALLSSTIDYGCFVYGAAAKTLLAAALCRCSLLPRHVLLILQTCHSSSTYQMSLDFFPVSFTCHPCLPAHSHTQSLPWSPQSVQRPAFVTSSLLNHVQKCVLLVNLLPPCYKSCFLYQPVFLSNCLFTLQSGSLISLKKSYFTASACPLCLHQGPPCLCCYSLIPISK